MAAQAEPKVILYHYHFSAYSHKVSWYLGLRGIKYHQCMQPSYLPRPDLASLGISYRRIPVLAIGNDVFCDTYLIIRELERRYPEGRLLHDGDVPKMEEWESWSNAFFPSCVKCLPTSLPLMKDQQFIKDREELCGRKFSKEALDAERPAGLEEIREGFAHMERILSDGRQWVLGEEFSLVDIQAIWPLEWVTSIPGALENTSVTPETFPKTFAYISRFYALLRSRCPDPKVNPVVSGPDAKETILSYVATPTEVGVQGGEDQKDFRLGEEVEVVPVDTGRNHPQKGKVRGLNKERVVLEVAPAGEERTVRVVFPIRGYEIRNVSAQDGARL